jgi:hypothetical protein
LPVFSTIKSRLVSPGGAVTNKGSDSPLATLVAAIDAVAYSAFGSKP